MGWISAVAPALKTAAPFISAGTSLIAGRQASAAGEYNKAVANRNATALMQEAEAIEKQKQFDLARFDQQFTKFQGEAKTAILTSGTTLEGSGLRVMRYNAEQAVLEKDILTYNSKVEQSKKIEEANFARMQGEIAKQQAKSTELGYYAQAGTSLLKAFG